MTVIETQADVKRMVDEFYATIRADALLNPIGSDIAHVDWAHHLPKRYAFWNGMALGKPGHVGAPFAAHVRLPLSGAHIERWLELFRDTVDSNFSRVGATRAKSAAASIAHTFALRMGLVDSMAGKFI